MKIRIVEKLSSATINFTAAKYLKAFLMRALVILPNVIFKRNYIVKNAYIQKMCITQWTIYFQNDQCMMLQKSCTDKNHLKSKTDPIVLTEYMKFTDTDSDSTHWNWPLKNFPVKFWCRVTRIHTINWKNYQNTLSFSNYIRVKLDLLHVFQTTHFNKLKAIDIRLSSYYL